MRNNITDRIIWILNLFVFIVLTNCSSDNKLAGASSETTNGITVAGNIEYIDGVRSARVYLHQDGAPWDSVLFQIADENGDFIFENLNADNYRLSILDESGDYGLTKNINLKADEVYTLEDVKLDSLIQIYLVINNQISGTINSIIFPDYGWSFTSDITIDQDTISLVKVPKGSYQQIIIESYNENSTIKNHEIALLAELLEIKDGENIYLDLSLKNSLDTPKGFYSENYSDINIYDTVVVSDYTSLDNALRKGDPTVVILDGSISSDTDLLIESQIVLIGSDTNAVIDGFGIKAIGHYEVVFKNIKFTNANNNSLEIINTRKVWIDNCIFENATNNLVLIENNSDSISVSKSKFISSNSAIVVGSVDADGNLLETIGKNNISLYHNYFNGMKNTAAVTLLGAQVHLQNNLWENISATAIYSSTDSKAYLEGNSFVGVDQVIELDETNPGQVYEEGSLLINSDLTNTNATIDFINYNIPKYSSNWVLYTLGIYR